MGWSSTFGATCKSWQSVYSLEIPPLPPRCLGLMCCKQCTVCQCRVNVILVLLKVGRSSRRRRSPPSPTCGCVDFDYPLMWHYGKIVGNSGSGWSLLDVEMDHDTFVWVCPFSLIVSVFLSISLARCLWLALDVSYYYACAMHGLIKNHI